MNIEQLIKDELLRALELVKRDIPEYNYVLIKKAIENEYNPYTVKACIKCGCNELLCGFPKNCTSENNHE